MRSRVFDQREFDCFISYGSEDREIADRLKELIEQAGLKVFLDIRNFHAGNEVVEGLATEIGQSKSCLALVSQRSIEKKYFKEELRLASVEAINHDSFRLIVAVIDQTINPTDHFKSLSVRSWLSMPNGELTITSVRDLMLALRGRESLPQSHQPHVYVSCSWRDGEVHPREAILREMKAQGAFLIGDSLDQQTFKEDGVARITRIMSGCSGFVGIYPDRRDSHKPLEELYKYFREELRIAEKLGLVKSLFCANVTSLPDSIRKELVFEWREGEPGLDLKSQISGFLDDVGTRHPHTFLATDFKQSFERNQAAKDIMEFLMGMHCRMGREVLGNSLREQLRTLIQDANLVVADLACSFEGESSDLKVNINTCVEAGMAIAHLRPLFLTALDATLRDPKAKKTDAIPFFFRDHSIEWYRSDSEFLANIYKIGFNRRRRVINDELP
jgi:hypothetical protein